MRSPALNQAELFNTRSLKVGDERKRVNARYLQQYPAQYCLDRVRSEEYLWDMRCWHRYKDRREIEAWLDDLAMPTGAHCKNCGHAVFCIDLLLFGHRIPRSKVIRAILDNPHKKFEGEEYCSTFPFKEGFGSLGFRHYSMFLTFDEDAA